MKLEEVQVLINGKIGPYKKAMQEMKRSTEDAVRPTKKALSSVTNEINSKTSIIRNALATMGKYFAVAYIVRGLYTIGKQSTITALEVSASINQIKRLMGESTQSFLKWSKSSALAFNISTADATKYGAVYSNLFSNFIKDSEQLSAYTVQMLKTSAIISSATGRTMDDVMNRIRSGMLGSTEAIEDLGINVNVSMLESTRAFQQFANGRSWDQLDFNTQQAIRMMAILEQANTKFGDKLMQGPTTSLARFNALLKNCALNIGNALLPILEAIMPTLNAFAATLNKATASLVTFMQLLFGKKAKTDNVSKDIKSVNKGLNLAGDGAEGLDKGLGKAGKKAKDLKKEISGLLGFDEINLLNKKGKFDNDEDGDDKSGINLPKIDFKDDFKEGDVSHILDAIQKIKDALEYMNGLFDNFKLGFKDAFRFEGLDELKDSLKGIVDSIYEIFNDEGVRKAANSWAQTWSYALGEVAGAIGTTLLGLGIFIAESFNKSLNETKPDIKNWIIKNLGMMEEANRAVGDLARNISSIFYDVMTSESATNIGSSIVSTFTYAFMGAITIINGLGRDLCVGIAGIFEDNKVLITDALTGTLEAIEPIFETMKNSTKDLFEGIVGLYEEHMKPLIDSIFKGISDIVGVILEAYNTHILPVIREFSEKWASTYEEYVKPMMEELSELLGKVMDLLKELWERVLVPLIEFIASHVIQALAPVLDFLGSVVIAALSYLTSTIKMILGVLSGLIDFIVGVFTGDWDRAWSGIKKIFESIWNFIKDFIKITWDFIKGIFSSTLDFIKNIIITVFEGIKNTIIAVFTHIKDFISNTCGTVGKVISDIFTSAYRLVDDKVSGMFKSVKDWFGKVPDTVSDLWGRAVRFLEGIDLYKIGANIMKGLLEGIKSIAEEIWSTVTDIADGISNAITGFFDMHSPSRLMQKFGQFIGRGLSLGISDEEKSVLKESNELGVSVIRGFEKNDFNLSKKVNVSSSILPDLSELINQSLSQKSISGGDIIIQIGDTEFARFAISKINEEQERAGMTLLKI